ncbi:uncharacterized protein [Antedon mediterranea]|uniref:uncharacterized protein isoform X4 n=1 Tax=Antedon mediterranea TaxID=105859 RepID=UPI003AF50883
MNSKVHTGNEQEFENSSLSGNEEFLLEILDDNDEMIRCIEELIDDQNELCNEMYGILIESSNNEREETLQLENDMAVAEICHIARNKRGNLDEEENDL